MSRTTSLVLLLASMGFGTVTNADAATPTLSLFVDANANQGFAGSIVSANCDSTTIALACTKGFYGTGSNTVTCTGEVLTVNYAGTTEYVLQQTVNQGGGAIAIADNTCSISGTTQAVCAATLSASANGHSTESASTTTYTGSQVHYYQVPITAGASKLSATSTCASANAARPTAAAEMYKVVVVVPAAAVLAGAAAILL